MNSESSGGSSIGLTSWLHPRTGWTAAWRAWRAQSLHHQVGSAIVTVGAMTVVVKAASVLKELVVAYQFGTGDSLDAYLMAFLIPQFGINLIGGSLNAALIPAYVRLREQAGNEAAFELLSSVMRWSVGLLVLLAVLLALTASPVVRAISPGFSPQKVQLTTSLYLWLLPVLILTGVSTSWSAILNAHDRFWLAAIAPILPAIVITVAVLWLGRQWEAYALALGMVIGAACEVVLLGWGLGQLGIPVFPSWRAQSPALQEVWQQYWPMLAGACLMGSAGVISQSLASLLDPGSVSILSYGTKFPTLLLGIGSMAVSTAVLPHFSRLVANGDWKPLRHALSFYSRILLAIIVPFMGVMMYFSPTIVAGFFERGAFLSSDTPQVAAVQALLLLQLPGYIVGMLYVRALSALQANRWLMWGAGLNFVVNVLCSYLLMHWWKVQGIAFASSLMYLGSCVFLWLACRRVLARCASSHAPVHQPHSR